MIKQVFTLTLLVVGFSPFIGYGQKNTLSPGVEVAFNLPDAGYNIYYLNFRIAYTFLKSKD